MHGIFTAKYATATMLNLNKITHTVKSVYSKREITMITLLNAIAMDPQLLWTEYYKYGL